MLTLWTFDAEACDKSTEKIEKRQKQAILWRSIHFFTISDWKWFERAHWSLLRYLIIPYIVRFEVSEVFVSKKIKTSQVWKWFCLFLRISTNLGYLVFFFLLGTQWMQNNSQGRLSFCAEVMKQWNRTLNCVLASYLVQKSWKTTAFYKISFDKKNDILTIWGKILPS